MSRIFLFVVAAFALVGCVSGDWPTGKDMDAYDHPVVKERYDAASAKALGTAEDIRQIKALVRKESGLLDFIRWRTKTEVILYVTFNPNLPQGLEDYYSVLRKEDGRWSVFARYLALVV